MVHNTSFLRRMGAILYDALLVLALLFVATIPFIAIRGGEPVEPGDNRYYQATLLVLVYLFFTGFWSWRGKTLGMQSWRLRLEKPDGSVPDFGAASLRFATAILSWLPLGLGFLWQLWDKDRLTWHDRLSGTRIRHYSREDE